jgi:cytosine/adenosine deaminase-related metal-dependent hydrolase
MIIKARYLISPGYKPKPDPILFVGEGVYQNKISNCEPELVFEDGVILPGLINSHCHLELSDVQIPAPLEHRFSDWIRALQKATLSWSTADYEKSFDNGLQQSICSGTTTTINVGNHVVQKGNRELPYNDLVIGYKELIGLDPTQAEMRHEQADQSNRRLCVHAPYSCSPELIRKVKHSAESSNYSLMMHLAESLEEEELYKKGTGRLSQFLSEIFPTPSPFVGHQGIYTQLINAGLLSEAPILVHGNLLSDSDLKDLAQRKGVIVHCPGSHLYFNHPEPDIHAMLKCGLSIALGTDSLASNTSLSLFREMRLFFQKYPELGFDKILKMVTLNPALALGLTKNYGSFSPGDPADFIVVRPAASLKNFNPESLIQSEPHMLMVVKNGQIIFNDAQGIK